MREKYESISNGDVIEVLKKGADKARTQAAVKMKEVREKVGVALY